MKLQAEEVQRIVNKVAMEWREKQLATIATTEDKLRYALNEIFIKELKVEDDLNKDVEVMLGKYEKEFQKGALDRRKMFLMIKAQLVKDRKIVL